ncbi:MAG: GyrI-like domain-containing protein [Methanobacteriaceae archaeon]|jgi:effector-binding domain-containing protein|nr:GyrI-like domain-containing protein [Candidatus Methanorudis spinitermitis]
MEIKEKIIEEEKLAIINYKGPVKDMYILISKLTTWVEVNEVETTGPPFAIYYTSPDKVDEDKMIYDMGIPIDDDSDIEGNDEINIVELLKHRVLAIIHKGSYSTINKSYKKMVDYSIENNYDIIGSPKEVYFNTPYEVPEEELITEVQFPVIKM